MTRDRAAPVVLSAPSGTGKTTIARRLVEVGGDFCFSVSVTTRSRREGEREGVDYAFVDRATFERRVRQGAFVEWAEVHGELYGTPGEGLEAEAARGRHVVLDIDVQGALQVRARLPDATLVFVLPPSVDALLSRLEGRGTETTRGLGQRLATALRELEVVDAFDYVVINDDLDRAVARIRALVEGAGGAPKPAEVREEVAHLRNGVGKVLRERFAGSAN